MATPEDRTKDTTPPEKVNLSPDDSGEKKQEKQLDLPPEARKVSRQIIIGIGGTGLETLKHLCDMMRINGLKFGDETNSNLKMIPHAIFVDADQREIDAATAARSKLTPEEERARKIIAELKGMGVRVVCIRNPELEADLKSMKLMEELTEPTIHYEDPDAKGCETDSRLGMAHYVTQRERVLREVREIVGAWGQGRTPAIGSMVTLTTIGGLHGGTGPLANLLTPDVLREIKAVISGSDDPRAPKPRVQIMAERYGMTAESAGIDNQRKSEGPHVRRMAQTAVNLVLWNAVEAQRGIALSPRSKWMERMNAEHNFVVGGRNDFRKARQEGGHYDPTETIATSLGVRILDRLDTGGARSNMRYIDRTAGESSPTLPNVPTKAFSGLGGASLRTDPDQGVRVARAKADKFAEEKGLNAPNEKAALDELELIFRKDDPVEGVLDKAEVPIVSMDEFGQEEQIPKRIRTIVDQFKRKNLSVGLKEAVIVAKNSLLRETTALIEIKTQELKAEYGLRTTMFFLDKVSELLTTISDTAEIRVKGVDKATLANRMENIEKEVNDIATFPIPETGMFGWFTGSKKKRKEAITNLNTMLENLVSNLTEFAIMARDSMFLREFTEVMPKITEKVRRLKREVEIEFREAQAQKAELEERVTERAWRNAFDVVQPLGEEDMDVTVLRLAAREEILEALREHSAPLLVPASNVSRTEIFGQKDAEDKDRRNIVRSVTVPLKEEAGKINQELLEAAPKDTSWTAVAVPEDGTYTVIQEVHGVNFLVDDMYVRQCLDLVMGLPPTVEEARRMDSKTGGMTGSRGLLNREGLFPWKRQAAKLLPPVFKALAKRRLQEAGGEGKGEIRTCKENNCGLDFFVQKTDIEQELDSCYCDGCKALHEDEKDDK